MKVQQRACERTYTTTLIQTEQPLDLTAFCELIARQMLSDKKYFDRGENNNGK